MDALTMKLNRLHIIALLLFCIVAGSVAPGAYRPELFSHLDAADHIIGYLVLSFAVAFMIRSHSALVLAGALSGLALSLELIQALIPSRDASFRDLYSSVAGILIGIAAGRTLAWITERRLKISSSPRGS
jgi:VanZ family protein